MEIKKKIGKHIQELRLKRKLKQSELAEMVNIATKTQSCVETGRNFPSAELLERYANAFQIDLSEILNISHIKKIPELKQELIAMIDKANNEETILIYKLINNIIN